MLRLGYYSALYAFLLTAQAHAAVIMRCEDDQGHITYTQFGCTAKQHPQQQVIRNPPPGSIKPPRSTTQPTTSTQDVKAPRVTVIGAKEAPCGVELSSEERRKAIIRQQVRSGMTRNDIESSLGQPDNIREHNGQTHYLYQSVQEGKRSKRRSVSFDENGCVKGNASNTRKAKSGQ